MKKRLVCVLPALALLSFSSLAARADQFDRIETSADTYWVPAPTPPPPGYASSAPAPSYYYGAPPPGYYYAPPPPRVHFFIGLHFH